MKIALFEIEDWERAGFERLSAEHDVVFTRDPLVPENARAYADAEIVSAFTASELRADVLEQLEHIRLIATRSTGYDHIDTAWCDERGVVVSNVPAYGCETVAEHVFALLLALSHRIVEASDRVRRGDFSPNGLQGFDLHGKTLGVVGTGDIGRCVITIARGFSMPVLAFDLRPDEDYAKAMGFRYAPFDEVLSASDVITLHVPANERTRNLISEPQFDLMKSGVVLINTARGTIVDTQALVRAIAEKKVAAAGLDVLAEEPTIREEAELLRSVYKPDSDNIRTLLANELLIRLPNVIVTPHTAFNTREAVQKILDTTYENIAAFAGGRCLNAVAGAQACPPSITR